MLEVKEKMQIQMSHMKQALIIIGVIVLGLLAVNLFLNYRFKLQLLSDPCTVCLEKNPQLWPCIQENANKPKIKIEFPLEEFNNSNISYVTPR